VQNPGSISSYVQNLSQISINQSNRYKTTHRSNIVANFQCLFHPLYLKTSHPETQINRAHQIRQLMLPINKPMKRDHYPISNVIPGPAHHWAQSASFHPIAELHWPRGADI